MRKALVVGINDYGEENKLSGCVNDAEEISRLLSCNEDGSKNFDVKLSNSCSATNLTELVKNCFGGTEDVALFYFSGHGFSSEKGSFLVVNEPCERDSLFSMDELSDIINKSKVRNKVLILDCCFSASIGEFNLGEFHTALISRGVSILTACREDETALEIDGHGLFTSLLSDALSGGAANLLGQITIGSIYSYIDQALSTWDQRPIFKTNTQEFISLRQVAPRISIKDLKEACGLFVDDEFRLDPSFEFTNTKETDIVPIEPYATELNIEKFKKLQKLEGLDLVEPVGEEHMYFAAMNSKSCRLTRLGKYYKYLIDNKRI